MGHNGPACKRPMYIRSLRANTHNIFYSICVMKKVHLAEERATVGML